MFRIEGCQDGSSKSQDTRRLLNAGESPLRQSGEPAVLLSLHRAPTPPKPQNSNPKGPKYLYSRMCRVSILGIAIMDLGKYPP